MRHPHAALGAAYGIRVVDVGSSNASEVFACELQASDSGLVAMG